MKRYLILITCLCYTLTAIGQSREHLPKLPQNRVDSLGVGMASILIHHPEDTQRVQQVYTTLAKIHELYPKVIRKIKNKWHNNKARKDTAKYNVIFDMLQWRLRYLDAYYVLGSNLAGKEAIGITNQDLHKIILKDMDREGGTIRKLPLHCENVTLIDCTHKNFRILMAKNMLPVSDDGAYGNNDLDVVYTLDETSPAKSCTVKGGETRVLECGDKRLGFTSVRSRKGRY